MLILHALSCLLKGSWSLLILLMKHIIVDIWGRKGLSQMNMQSQHFWGHKSLQKK
jgi:hypothetical protein